MALQFPAVGSTQQTTFAPTTPQAAADGVANTLIAAGWTKTGLLTSALLATLPTSLPSNGDNFNITTAGGGSVLATYTFVTSLNNAVPNQIKIAATGAQQAAWVTDAINAGSGSGTEWSSATVASTLVTAVNGPNSAGRDVTFTAIATGFSSNSTFSITGTVGGWTGVGGTHRATGRGYVMTSAATQAGLQASLWISDAEDDGTFLDFWWGSSDSTLQSVTLNANNTIITAGSIWGSMGITGGRTLQINANAHQFFTWLASDKATAGCQVGMCVPYLRAAQTPLVVNGVTNAGGLFQIQTSTAHGLTTGNSVTLFGIGGTPNANGVWTITVVDATHFTLDTSTFAGAYTSGGLMGGSGGSTPGTPAGLSRCFFGWADFRRTGGAGYANTWRNTLGAAQVFVCANENSYGQVGSSTIIVRAIFPQPRTQGLYYNWGGFSNLSEPLVGWPGTAIGAQFLGMGQMWSSFIVADSIPMDRTNTGYDSHNWINQTDFDGIGALWIATT